MRNRKDVTSERSEELSPSELESVAGGGNTFTPMLTAATAIAPTNMTTIAPPKNKYADDWSTP